MIGQINAVVFSFALWTYGWARGRWILHEANHTREQTAGGAGGAGGRPGRHGRLGGTARTTTGDSRRGAATAATVLHGAAGGGCWRIKRTESCGQTTIRGTPTRKGRRHPPPEGRSGPHPTAHGNKQGRARRSWLSVRGKHRCRTADANRRCVVGLLDLDLGCHRWEPKDADAALVLLFFICF
jgi:hypothetical protein